MAAHTLELHHAAPRCLLTLHDAAHDSVNGHRADAWLEFTVEARRWRIPVEISRRDLEKLVRASEVLLERERHRLLHSTDWQRWGRRGGLATLRRYGSDWYALLALKRWGRITGAELEAARPLR